MKGDFSGWQFNPNDNFNGVLEQQGRVRLDRDGLAQTQIMTHWHDTAAEAILGAGIAAVAASQPDALAVIKAVVDGDAVVVALEPGRLWADGRLLYLAGDGPVQRSATYLTPPLQDPPGSVSTLGSTSRDAVILEVWREAIHGFQLPERLIEPALGGVDTSERMHTAFALRLFRLADGETCEDIHDQLQDDDALKGKLTVSLRPTEEIPDPDCPVVEGGGYTGFEHYLYRIEIAETNSSEVQFKWSPFNGGLVGRGVFDATTERVAITANLQAIATAGQDTFYLEAVEWDEARGHWRVSYGAHVTLNDSNELELPTTPTFGTLPDGGTPAAPRSVFFRLWHELRPISDFPESADPPEELRDGIRLAFESATGHGYRPGDYWIFAVRAGLDNGTPLIEAQPPEGIRYHRVPLAELHWNTELAISAENEEIEDCRKPFRPLTNQKVCCTFLVGDGTQSRGDFNSLEEALRHLPVTGGKLCLLPGYHRANVQLVERQNIHITGCGNHTTVTPEDDRLSEPIFRLDGCQNIQIDHLTLVANEGTGIQVVDAEDTQGVSQNITIRDNEIIACLQAIQIRTRDVAGDNDIWIAYNQIAMLDKPEGKPAIFSLADGVLIERNQITVVPAPDPDNPDDPRPEEPPGGIFDPCVDARKLYGDRLSLSRFIADTRLYLTTVFGLQQRLVYLTPGGIQIAGGSERVKIQQNHILGGWGHGVILGDLPTAEDGSRPVDLKSGFVASLPDSYTDRFQAEFVDGLYEIEIADNTIQHMGLSGIGVVAFLSVETIQLMVRIEDLTIYRNAITHCAQQIPAEIPSAMVEEVGFGGIALAACENVTIQENRIENNGTTHIEPICGIFILLGEKIDISHNRILNNGPRTSERDDDLRRGSRGGIVIKTGFRQLVMEFYEATEKLSADGIPAVKIHGNIVTQPLGQAVFIIALGPISIVGNQLTSQGNDFLVNPYSLLAATVFIFNLGISRDLIAAMLLASFYNLAATNPDSLASLSADEQAQILAAIQQILYLPTGSILCANNQVVLDLRSEHLNVALSSQMLASLDDVAYNGNQAECNSFIDFVIADVALFAVTIRSNDNRFQEGVTFTAYSLLSFGLMNTATGNQATHCLQVLGSPPFTIEEHNRVLFTFGCEEANQGLQEVLAVPQQTAARG